MHLSKNNSEQIEVRGRGELQLGILLETMRREGYEISVSSPRVLLRKDSEGNVLEPIEELTVLYLLPDGTQPQPTSLSLLIQLDLDMVHTGLAIEKMSLRKADLKSFEEVLYSTIPSSTVI